MKYFHFTKQIQLFVFLLLVLILISCGGNSKKEISANGQKVNNIKMTIYKSPTCGCCQAWIDIAEEAGFNTKVINTNDMSSVKLKAGIPSNLSSCHTSFVKDYVAEGHVPIPALIKLLQDSPKDAKGLSVPGMPLGSPGMETPDKNKEQQYDVFLLKNSGEHTVFQTYLGKDLVK